MYGLLVTVVLGVVLAINISVERTRHSEIVTEAKADAIAVNFWTYHRTVANRVNLTGEFTGSVDTETLTFPDGFVNKGRWFHYAQDGVLYTWTTHNEAKRSMRAIAARGPGVTAGTANADGSMTTLTGFATGTILPTGIPAGALVIIGN